MHRFCLASSLALALVWITGCSPTGPGLPPSAKVKGTVQMDGKPLPAGELHFAVQGAPPSPLLVKDGAFSGTAIVGKNKVELVIMTEGGPSTKHAGTMTKTNTAPGKYWGPKTTLEADVTAGGANDFTFDLSSK